MDEKNHFQLSKEKFYEMSDFLKDKKSHELDISELENYIDRNGRELLRRLLIDYQAFADNKEEAETLKQTTVS
ncbi:MAG: hypothetical protein GY862_28240 [Gammaproteobacteria bacterium]|nr:hypothetical protein [Gammaproteobacteria bacterium]